MLDLAKVLKKYRLTPLDTGRGVTLANFAPKKRALSAKELNKLLSGELGQEISRIIPDAGDAFRGTLLRKSVDYKKAFSAANEGKGKATDILFRNIRIVELKAK